ncbi:hypothetical protein WJ970_28865 [Achromobacter xylosoxidans]
MQQVLCPQCGAPVSFTSAASVMAVCGACRSTLLKDAASVRRIGEAAEVLEDYSPICLGAVKRTRASASTWSTASRCATTTASGTSGTCGSRMARTAGCLTRPASTR